MTDYVNVFVVGEAIRETRCQIRMAAVVAGIGSQKKLEDQDRASQITARLIRNGQAHRAMRVKFRRVSLTVLLALYQANRVDDPFDTDVRCAPVTRRHRGHARLHFRPIWAVLYLQPQAA